MIGSGIASASSCSKEAGRFLPSSTYAAWRTCIFVNWLEDGK